MKIQFKISFSQLTELVKGLQQDRLIQPAITIPEKANKYLFENVFKKLLKKQIDKYEARKEFKIEITYPEAYLLLLNLQTITATDNYRQAVVVRFTSILHQQLQSK